MNHNSKTSSHDDRPTAVVTAHCPLTALATPPRDPTQPSFSMVAPLSSVTRPINQVQASRSTSTLSSGAPASAIYLNSRAVHCGRACLASRGSSPGSSKECRTFGFQHFAVHERRLMTGNALAAVAPDKASHTVYSRDIIERSATIVAHRDLMANSRVRLPSMSARPTTFEFVLPANA